MKKNDITAVVAIAIGAAIVFIIKRFIMIPSGIPNNNIDISYSFVALLAAVYGGIPAAIAGFIGHWLMDTLTYGSAWYSWILTTAFVGFGLGWVTKDMAISQGIFERKDHIKFFVGQYIVNIIGWLGLAPSLDILVYNEPAQKVFLQGIVSSITNGLSTGIIGLLLIGAYAKTRTQSGSLSQK